MTTYQYLRLPTSLKSPNGFVKIEMNQCWQKRLLPKVINFCRVKICERVGWMDKHVRCWMDEGQVALCSHYYHSGTSMPLVGRISEGTPTPIYNTLTAHCSHYSHSGISMPPLGRTSPLPLSYSQPHSQVNPHLQHKSSS